MPDPVKGEVPHAVVVPQPGRAIDTDALIAWLGERLAGYKRLGGVEVVDEVPRTASGKTLRRTLTARYTDTQPPAR